MRDVAIAQPVKYVIEVLPISINKDAPLFILFHREPAAEHRREHGVGVSSEGGESG